MNICSAYNTCIITKLCNFDFGLFFNIFCILLLRSFTGL